MYRQRKILTALQTPGTLFSILNNLDKQKKFIQQRIQPVLSDAIKNNDGSIDEEDIKKITNYYGLAVPAILGEAFCALRGSSMTEKERLASTCQGAITGLGDDFFDKNRMGETEAKDLIENPQDYKPTTSAEKIFVHFYRTVLDSVPDKIQMQKSLFKVSHAQLQSKLQTGNKLSTEELQHITIAKGGTSLLFYRTAFANEMNAAEEDMLYKLGGLMQLSNDIFDVFKDVGAGINTLMSSTNKVNDIRALYIQLLKDGYDAACKTSYKPANIKKFINIISIGIFSRCFVCFDHLEKSEATSGGVFSPQLYSRKQLICDMDTAANKWKSVKYHIKFA